ncbi:hypothetical protein H6G89_18330 [Oscillatoria sp. FACHB-1407]|uniref:hypothetical protein n=1 Tax=Oscillatoria sp. FACHB-1407 TaxID=2692847 RepID=UPI00168413FE|nr:hypothetical protein [Oscillatoria sp. FACHB-1407]MBD2463001.1 hypothetical protein [Oscillatoria sp. FACHB-1407]
MTQSNLLELAKQGDPTAIATMMNQQLQPRGITATTDLLPGRCLQVVLESAQVLNRQALTTFVQKGLKNLGVQTLDSVKIIGRQIGASEPAWIQDIAIAGVPIPGMTEPFPESVPSKMVTPPPPPPNRGVTPIAPVSSSDPSIGNGIESSTEAAALHDFHDSRLAEPAHDEGDLPNYSPIPGAYRPLEADNALLLNDSDFDLRGTHALDYPDQPLEESDYDYGDDYDVMPGGSHALHYPDDPLDDPEDYGDNYDEGFVVSPTYNTAPPTTQAGDSLSLDDDYGDDYDQGFTAASANAIQFDDLSEGQEPESGGAVVYPEARESAQPEEEYSPIPWTALIVSLVATWIVGLVGYAIWSGAASRTASQSTGDPSTAVSPPASPTSQANVPSPPPVAPASPTGQSPAAQPSPGVSANPALQFSPSPQASPPPAASPSPQANASPAASPAQPSPQPTQASPPPQPRPAQAVAIAPPAPPAITCRPVPFGANSGPVELSNLGFDTSITDADGHYVVGCITNHSDQPISKLTISFQGRSTQNQAVSQTGLTDLTFTNLRPRQAVPFRSLYTVNPEINTMTITNISWVPAGSAQTRQVQVNFPLRR